MALSATLHSLPIFVRLAGRPVILVGDDEPKRRLLTRAGATIVGEPAEAVLAIVAGDVAAAARLKARGVLVNVVDRPELCDFTLPAIVERGEVIVAVGTGGASAGLAAALRQRIEAWLPAGLGALAAALREAREAIRARLPNADDRRRAIGAALAEGGSLNPFRHAGSLDFARDRLVPASTGQLASAIADEWTPEHVRGDDGILEIALHSPDPDELTLRQARTLALAERVYHDDAVPPAILDRARADATRTPGPPPAGATGVYLRIAR